MRIAMISSGNSIHVKKIANSLSNMGQSITFFTLPNHNKLLNDFDSKIEIVKLPFSGKKGYYLNALFLKKEIKKGKYDLVNSHYISGYGTLARLVDIHPLVLSVLGSDIFEYPYKSKFHMHRIISNLNAGDVITSTSHAMVKELLKFYHCNKPIYVTPFGVDLKTFYLQKKNHRDVFKFGIIKKMEYNYGIDILLKAFQLFCTKVKNKKVELVIYGDGSALRNFKILSVKLGLQDKVEFKGFIPNESVPDALSEIDVACFPSYNESFGVAAVEAMACGTPVIVSNTPGFSEIVKDNITGLIIERGNITELFNAMLKMYTMSEFDRKKMGEAGVEHVKKFYSFDDNMKDYLKALKKAMGIL